jgi:hypothetical protein
MENINFLIPIYSKSIKKNSTNFTTNFTDIKMYAPLNNQCLFTPDSPLFWNTWLSAFVIGNIAYAGLGGRYVGTSLSGDDSFIKMIMKCQLVSMILFFIRREKIIKKIKMLKHFESVFFSFKENFIHVLGIVRYPFITLVDDYFYVWRA